MNNKGITLIALVVTIIVMIILAGVSINGILNTGTVEIAKEVAFKSEAKDIKDAWESKIIGMDSTFLEYANVKDILSDLNASEEMLEKLEIQNGELVYKDEMCTPEEKQWFESIGIFGGVSIIANVKTNVRVIGGTITVATKQGMDVIVVLDKSGSMARKYSDTDSTLRGYFMTEIINNVMDQVLKNNDDNRIGLVSFGGDAHEFEETCNKKYVETLLPLDRYTTATGSNVFFTRSTSFVGFKSNYIKNSSGSDMSAKLQIVDLTGTYIQGGAYKAYQILRDRDNKKNLPVIFLITDGAPNDNFFDMEKYGALSDTILTNPGHTNYWGVRTSQQNSIKRGLNTVLTMGKIKANLPKSMIYTISIAELSNDIDKKYVELLLNPNPQTIANAKKGKTNVVAYENEIRGLNSTNLKKFAEDVERQGVSYHYADGFSIGALKTDEFEKLFAKFIEEIEVNLEREYTVSENNSITGVYELDSDNLSIETKEKDPITGEEQDKKYDFILAETEEDGSPALVKIKVTAAAYTPATETTPSKKVEHTEHTVESVISIQDIKDGADPNLYYMDGTIKWNVRSEYKDNRGLAQEAKDGVKLIDNTVAEIEEVILELPVNILKEN